MRAGQGVPYPTVALPLDMREGKKEDKKRTESRIARENYTAEKASLATDDKRAPATQDGKTTKEIKEGRDLLDEHQQPGHSRSNERMRPPARPGEGLPRPA